MADQQYISNFNIGGINLYINPLFSGGATDGQLIRAVNVDSIPLGAKIKRPGYVSFLGTADGSQINTLSSWTQDNGTSSWLYRFSGTKLYYYDVGAGTGDWAICGNGTFTGTHIGGAVLGNTLIIGDGVGSTRHTTNGTSFTNTTLAPAGEFFEQYQTRIYIGGTSSTLFYSTTGDATNWVTSGTSDSSSLPIPGAGKINKVFKLGDRLHIGKAGGNIFRWDGFSLVDTSTTLNMTSSYSYGSIEDSGLYINRNGVYMDDISGPQIISNPISRFIFNESNTGMAGTAFDAAPGVVYKYDYFLAVGSTRDDLTNEPLNNGIFKYNVLKNEWLTYQFANNPKALHSYKDNVGSQQLVFGDTNGQCYLYGGTALSDNGVPIAAVIELFFDFQTPQFDKDWRWLWAFFNPGCEAQIQFACANTFIKGKKIWQDLGDFDATVGAYRFPTGSRSKFLFIRIKESSSASRFDNYGIALSAVIKDPG